MLQGLGHELTDLFEPPAAGPDARGAAQNERPRDNQCRSPIGNHTSQCRLDCQQEKEDCEKARHARGTPQQYAAARPSPFNMQFGLPKHPFIVQEPPRVPPDFEHYMTERTFRMDQVRTLSQYTQSGQTRPDSHSI